MTPSRLGKRYIKLGQLYFDGTVNLIFPSSCLVCDRELPSLTDNLCSFCISDLPRSYFETTQGPTSMDKLFWGRVDVENTYAYLLYNKLGASSSILTAIKYRNNPVLAIHFGQRIALTTLESFESVPEVICPVPLHPKKEFIRGYNQSAQLAMGFSEASGIPLNPSLIRRTAFTETQTKKGRFKRWSNVEGKFAVHGSISNYQHILIIDDVITTGSTLESIIREIKVINPNIKVSVVTLAIAA